MKLISILLLSLLMGCTVQDGVREIKIEAKQFEFLPSTIELAKGEKVRLFMRSVDVTHGLSIPELGINERLEPGKTVMKEFTPDVSGEFTGVCSEYCGVGHGQMSLKVIVR